MTSFRMSNRNATLVAGVVVLTALTAGAEKFDRKQLQDQLEQKEIGRPGLENGDITAPSVPQPLTQGRSYPASSCDPLETSHPLRRDYYGRVESVSTSGVTWVICPILLDMPDSTSLYVTVDMSGGWDRPGLGCWVQRTRFTWNSLEESSGMFAKRNVPNMNEYSDDIWDANADTTTSWQGSVEFHGDNDIDTRAVLVCALDRAEGQYTSRSSLNGYYVEERKTLGIFGGG